MSSILTNGLTVGAVNMTFVIVIIAGFVIAGVVSLFMNDDDDVVVVESVDGSNGNWEDV